MILTVTSWGFDGWLTSPLQFGRRTVLTLGFAALSILAGQAQSPTPGLIFKPATAGTPGAGVLDPNGDGYVSTAATGFTTGAGDLGTQSEIPYKYLPQRTALEPNSDLRVGPNHKFTDFADVAGGGSSVGFYVDASGNYMFRFRLGGSAPNSKGYSIAIDTDNKFGFTGPNADPNPVTGNPGFEMEILLASNFGVRLYNIDGTANPVTPATPATAGPAPVSPVNSPSDGCLVELPYVTFAHKAIAGTTNNGDLDVFYDFYVPISVIQHYFGSRTFFNSSGSTAVPFSLNTPLRMVANTIIAPHSVTKYQNISDIGGVNDAAYPNTDYAFADLITGTTPTTGATVASTAGNAIPARSAAPVVTSPIRTGATSVSGTSTEAVGTTITVYVNGAAQGTTTTVQSGGGWTLTGLSALAVNALVKATATASGKTQSDFSNEVQVAGNTPCATPAPAAPTGCVSATGIGGTEAAYPGHLYYLYYLDGTLVVHNNGSQSGQANALLNNPVTADAAGTYLFTGKGGNSCTNGPSVLSGTYLIRRRASAGACESTGYQVCIGTATTATPVVTTARPITSSTASISGTATAGASVVLFVDGLRYSFVTATGGSYTFSTATATLPPLTTGRTLTVFAAVNQTSTIVGTCQSAGVTLRVVESRAVTAPVVSSPVLSGATTVSGTSSEASGSTITLTTYASADGTGAVLATYTTTVQPNGSWSVTVPVLTSGSVKATVTATDYGTSGFSNVVAVQSRTVSVPVISSAPGYVERSTSVSGTSGAAAGSIITVYEDGDIIGTTTVVSGGTWTLTGLSDASGVSPNTLYPTLYAGGVLTATATETGRLPSTLSAPVTVGCLPLANKSFTASPVCQNNALTYTITNADPSVIYTLLDATSGTNMATGTARAVAGAGSGSLSIPTSVYNTAGTYAIKLSAFSVGAVSCNETSATSQTGTVNPLPIDKTTAAQSSTLGTGNTGTNINVAGSETGVTYQLLNISATPNTNVGSPKAGTGSTLALPTGPITTTTTYAVSAITASSCTSRLTQTRQVTYSTAFVEPLPVELSAFEAKASGADAVLNWRTATEKDNHHFVVEHSADGRLFTEIGRVAGAGNSSQPLAYSFTAVGSARLSQLRYYRLRQVDEDSTFAFSPVRSVQFASTFRPAAVLYPNPTTATVTLNLALLPAGAYTVSLLHPTGQTLSTRQLPAGRSHELDLTMLPAGVYLVRVQGATISLTQRVVKLQ